MIRKFFFKGILFSAIIFIGKESLAQEITDTRRKTESFKRLQPADIRADVASFTYGGITESAQAPVLEKISPTIIKKDSIVIEGNGIYAKVSLEPFDPKVHKLMFDDDEKTPIKIDRKTYYGDYGKMPRTEVSFVLMVIDGDTVDVPSYAYSDLKNMHFSYIDKGVERTGDAVFKSKDGKKVYLYLFSKDNTGSYEVTWIFLDKKYFRRVLDYSFL